jgi:tetratricopeptide (TPR) repeat protein
MLAEVALSPKQRIAAARRCFAVKEYQRAEPLLLRVVEDHPNFADVHNMLGVIHHEQGDYDRAQRDFQRALQINPRYTDAALNLAVLCNDTGQYEVAQEMYDCARTSAQGGPGRLDRNVAAKIANMHAEVGDTYRMAGEPEPAIAEYERALGLCPAFVDIRAKLAATLRDAGHLDRSIEQYETILGQNAAYLPARLNLGLALLTAGRRAEAIAHWQKVLRLAPGDRTAEAYLKLAGATPQP